MKVCACVCLCVWYSVGSGGGAIQRVIYDGVFIIYVILKEW